MADLWSRPERAARGPAPEHSRHAIAAAAVAIADQEGLAAASMRKVAAAVGAGPASLYRYVENRDELLALMADAVTAELAFTGIPTDQGWRHDVLTIAGQLRSLYRRHPWMLDIYPGSLGANGLGPAAIDYLEGVLAALSPLAVPSRAKMEAAALLTGSVGLFVRDELTGGNTSPEAQQQTVARLVAVVGQGRHPHLAAALAGQGGTTGASFERLLIAVMEGVLGAKEAGASVD